MLVQWAITGRFDFEDAHGKILGAHFFGYEPSDFDFEGAFCFNIFEFDGAIRKNFHFLTVSAVAVCRLVFDCFDEAHDVPQFNPSVSGHVGVLQNLVQYTYDV